MDTRSLDSLTAASGRPMTTMAKSWACASGLVCSATQATNQSWLPANSSVKTSSILRQCSSLLRAPATMTISPRRPCTQAVTRHHRPKRRIVVLPHSDGEVNWYRSVLTRSPKRRRPVFRGRCFVLSSCMTCWRRWSGLHPHDYLVADLQPEFPGG